MITKEQLAASMIRECDIIVHLAGKVAPDSLEYRPGPNQRSMLELLRYLSYCASGGIRSLVAADWSIYSECERASRTMSLADFPDAMAQQKSEIAAFFEATSEDALATTQTKAPGGGIVMLGPYIFNGPFKWLVAYKMQLFLYAKINGAPEIGTSNLWGGADRAPRPAETT
jgi:hypothetical protein